MFGRKRIILAIVGLSIAALASVGLGSAAVVQQVTIPSSFTFDDACTGEQVLVTGEAKLLITSTVNANTVSSHLHSEFKATGVGLSSGLAYQEQVVANSDSTASLENGQATMTFVGRITIVAPGPGNNQVSPIFMHTTFDANGNLASSKLEAPTITCQ